MVEVSLRELREMEELKKVDLTRVLLPSQLGDVASVTPKRRGRRRGPRWCPKASHGELRI